MVASISASGGAAAALAYYDHLGRDEYYARGVEPPGRWADAWRRAPQPALTGHAGGSGLR